MASEPKTIDELLEAVQIPADETGSLDAIAALVEPFAPSLLILGTQEGKLYAVRRCDDSESVGVAPRLLLALAEQLKDRVLAATALPLLAGVGEAVGIRVIEGDRSLILGGILRQNADAFLDATELHKTLTACARMGWIAVRHCSETKLILTENRHLRTEHATFKLAHLQSTLAMIKEREERLALEANRLATEEFLRAAEKASQSKSEFLASMSHEIRTPMTAILGYAEELLAGVEEPEALEAASVIKRNGDHLLAVLDDILDISKIEAGRLEVHKTPCSPHEILLDTVSLMEKRAEAKGVGLKLELIGEVPDLVVTDPKCVRQILINLLGNAVKFTEKGEIRLLADFRLAKDHPSRLQFEVIDTGIGMSAEQVERLFQPFSQADVSIARKYGGTGLGLAISKRLAEMLGGDLTVQSTLGIGSRFTLVFEAACEASTGEVHGVRQDAIWQVRSREGTERTEPLRGRILLVEDSPDNQRLISALLRKAGAEIEVVSDGLDALERLLPKATALESETAQPRFDLVLMDIGLPRMDGLEATKRLRAAGVSLPIVALSAHAFEGQIQTAKEAGCNSYLVKPIGRRQLVEAIRPYLG